MNKAMMSHNDRIAVVHFTALIEVERVFDLPSNEARVELERLEKLGKAKRSTLAGAAFWSA